MADFRLLGVFEIWSGGQRVPTGQPRQRLALAALLTDAGRPVTPEALVNRIWGDTPPDRARHAMHEYLARIRRLLTQLDDASAPRLVRRGAVYVLEIDRERVDLHRFRRLTEMARSPECPYDTRVALLGEALALWRGEALADLSGEWVDRVRESSRRQRMEAAVLWAEALVRLGKPAVAIEPLAELAADNPLSEPVVAALMRALHATGRSVDALDWHARIRKRLIEDLGVESGAELQAVFQSVLRNETPPAVAGQPVAAAPEPGPAPPAAPREPFQVTPAQLPAAVPGFAGRERELAGLDAALAGLDAALAGAGRHGATVAICAVSGTAGVGKTALAIHWAHRAAARFPDGQLHVNLRGFDPAEQAMETGEAVRLFLYALQVPPQRVPATIDGQTALYRSLLAGRRMLIVLDNARDSAHVRPLLPGTPGCLVLVTSRNRLSGLVAHEGAQPVMLDLLTAGEARELLAHRLGHDRVAAQPGLIEEIISRCARLPLALALVTARAATNPHLNLSAVAAELRDAGRRWTALRGDDPASEVRAVFSWSYRALSPAAARLFGLLGLHPGPDLTAAAAASIGGLPLSETGLLLSELAGAQLVAEQPTGRYLLHDLLRAYAADQLRSDREPERRAATHRMVDHYLHSAYATERLLNEHGDPFPLDPPAPGVSPERPADRRSALAWLRAEHTVLLAIVGQAASGGLDGHTWRLTHVLGPYLEGQGHWHDWITVGQLALTAAQRADDPGAQVRAHRHLAVASTHLNRLDDAHSHLRQALDLTRQHGDLAGQAHTELRLADLSAGRGDCAEALDHARQALGLYETVGHLRGKADALNTIGWYHALLGEYDQTVAYCQQALALCREFGQGIVEATTWDSLGYAHHHLGNYPDARTCFDRAVDLFHDLGARYNQAETLTRLGDTDEAAGRPEVAREVWRRALAILDDLGHPDADEVRRRLRA